MEENKVITEKLEENEEEIILNNLKNFLQEIDENRQEKERLLQYFRAKDYKSKEQIRQYFLEKYELDEKIFDKYINALQDHAQNYMQKTDLLEEDVKNLEKQLSENAKRFLNKNFMLKIFMPYLYFFDLMQQFSVSMELFEKELKKSINNYIMQKNLDKNTKKYLQNLNKILDKKDEKEKEEKIEQAFLPLLREAKVEVKEYVELLENKLEQETDKIIQQTNNNFLLEHKVTEKDLQLTEADRIQHLENHVAILLSKKNKKEDYALINSINDSVKLNLDENLSFNLLKQVFNSLDKKQFSQIYAYCKTKEVNENTNLKDIENFAKQNKQKVKEIEKKLYKQSLDINFNPKKNINIIDF